VLLILVKTWSNKIENQMMVVSFSSNTTGAGTGTAIPSGAHEFTPVFYGVCDAQSLVFCVVFGSSLFVLLFLFLSFAQCIVCPLYFNVSDYRFGIFKIFKAGI